MTPGSASASVSDAELASIIATGGRDLGLDLSHPQLDRLVMYLHLVDRWNATYNLTAIRDLRFMAIQHVLDSLAIVPAVRARLERTGSRRLLDVGSGAGLPGVVIAVAVPDVEVVCVDSVGKKTAFITQAAASLSLQNIAARHARVESIVSPPAYDIVVSRAYASLLDFVCSTRHLLSPGGWWFAMKGRLPQDEIAAAASAGVTFTASALRVPGLDAERCLLQAPASALGAPGSQAIES